MTAQYSLLAKATAAVCRNRLGLALTAPIGDIFRLVREDSFILFTQPAGAAGPDGMYAPYQGMHFGWINSSKPAVRQRFTIAHEYGHAVFNDVGLLIDQDVMGAKSVPEKRANAFAAEFLAPSATINLWLTRHGIDPAEISLANLVRLGVYLGVSAEVALYRLRDETPLSEKRMSSIKVALDAGEHCKTPAYLGYQDWADTVWCLDPKEPHLPLEMREAAFHLFQTGLIDESRLAHLVRRSRQSLAQEMDELGIERILDDDDDPPFVHPDEARR